MPVLTRLVPSPLAVDIRPGALDGLTSLLADQRISAAGRIAIAVSEGSGRALRERLTEGLPDADWFPVAGGSVDAALKLADELRSDTYDTLVGIGGGKIIDVAKFAAARVGLPMVAAATNLAHDGICSPVATLDNDAGRGSYGVPPPIALLVDLDVVRQAPPRVVRAGIGEALSNLSAVADWELSHEVTGEPVDGLAVALARTGAEALLHRTDGIEDDAFLTVLAESLVLSGMAMSVAGTSRPSSGACHEISHALVALHPELDGQHGEQVGVGAAIAWHLRGDAGRTGELVSTLRRHGLPTLPNELGLHVTDFAGAVAYAPQTRPGRYTILEHLDLDEKAIRDAIADYVDLYGN